jgi:hypothetical protein
MLVRFRQDVIALRPKVVVILAGTNDVAGDIGALDAGNDRGQLEERGIAEALRRPWVELAAT